MVAERSECELTCSWIESRRRLLASQRLSCLGRRLWSGLARKFWGFGILGNAQQRDDRQLRGWLVCVQFEGAVSVLLMLRGQRGSGKYHIS